MRRYLPLAFVLVAFARAPLAVAHTGQGDRHDFLGGLLHPMTGLDHALAMLAVGVLAWTLGGRARLRLPVAFLAMMSLGMELGFGGLALPRVEIAATASVAAMGAMLLAGRALPAALALALVGLFGVLHGNAHGTEMQAVASTARVSGFCLATAGLHAGGFLLAAAVSALRSRGRARAAPQASPREPAR